MSLLPPPPPLYQEAAPEGVVPAPLGVLELSWMSDEGGGPPLPWPGAAGAPENASGGGIDTKWAGYDDEERGSVDDDDVVE